MRGARRARPWPANLSPAHRDSRLIGSALGGRADLEPAKGAGMESQSDFPFLWTRFIGQG
jgi:hypothetical protein